MTLLELLLALMIFAIIGTAAYSGLSAILTARQQSSLALQRLGELQLALHRLGEDFSQLVPREVVDARGERHGAFTTLNRDGALVAFTRSGWSNPLAQRRPDLQRVGYYFEENRLVRRHWPQLDGQSPPSALTTVLLTGVAAVELRFLQQSRWLDRWTPQITGAAALPAEAPLLALPQAVEVTLTLADWGEITRLWPTR